MRTVLHIAAALMAILAWVFYRLASLFMVAAKHLGSAAFGEKDIHAMNRSTKDFRDGF